MHYEIYAISDTGMYFKKRASYIYLEIKHICTNQQTILLKHPTCFYHLLERWRHHLRIVIIRIGVDLFTSCQAHLCLYHHYDLKISTINDIKALPDLSLLLWVQHLIKCEQLANNAPPCFQLSNQIEELFLNFTVSIGGHGHFAQIIGGPFIAPSINGSKCSITITPTSRGRVQWPIPLTGNVLVTKVLLEGCMSFRNRPQICC